VAARLQLAATAANLRGLLVLCQSIPRILITDRQTDRMTDIKTGLHIALQKIYANSIIIDF